MSEIILNENQKQAMKTGKISIRQARTAIPGLLDMIDYINNNSEKKFSEFEMAEIGCYVGDSSRVFAERVKQIYCIDPWMNDYDETDPSSYLFPMEVVEGQFDQLLKEFSNIYKIKLPSNLAVRQFEDQSLDFVYIDGNHLYEAVKEDVTLWLPKVRKGGFIGGHDYNHKWAPGVKPAVDEILGRLPDKTFQDTSWIKEVL